MLQTEISEKEWKEKCTEYREKAAELQDTVAKLKVRKDVIR